MCQSDDSCAALLLPRRSHLALGLKNADSLRMPLASFASLAALAACREHRVDAQRASERQSTASSAPVRQGPRLVPPTCRASAAFCLAASLGSSRAFFSEGCACRGGGQRCKQRTLSGAHIALQGSKGASIWAR